MVEAHHEHFEVSAAVEVAHRGRRRTADPVAVHALIRERDVVQQRPVVGEHDEPTRVGLERDIAVKILRADAADDDRERIQREARALAGVNHPNVLVVHDMGTRDGQLWVAMEFVRGGHLRRYLSRQSDLRWVQVVERFLDAARGLEAAHQAGIAHRDFKPDNVMIGDDGRVRVTDFGFALLDAGHHEREIDRRLQWIEGTPTYFPPEVLRGELGGVLGDQYSYCVALREMLELEGRGLPLRFSIRVQGLGWSVADGEVPTIGARFRQLVLATPIDRERIHFRIGTSVQRRLPGLDQLVRDLLFRGLVAEVERDRPIWETKRYVERPVLAKGDGPIPAYRKWCRQFYPATQAAPGPHLPLAC